MSFLLPSLTNALLYSNVPFIISVGSLFTSLIPVFRFPTVILVELWLLHGLWVQSLFLGGIHLNFLSFSLPSPLTNLATLLPLSESLSPQVLGHLKLSLAYIHILGFVVANFPLDKYLFFWGRSFLFAK